MDVIMPALFSVYKDLENISCRAILLLYWYNCKERELLEMVIDAEVDAYREDPKQLLRGTTVMVKILGEYFWILGEHYLHKILAPLLKQFSTKDSSVALSFQVNPTKIKDENPEKKLKKNQKVVYGATEKFVKTILSSNSDMHPHLCSIAKYLHDVVQEKLPGAETIALSGLLFLRFINPAICNPEITGKANPKNTRCFILMAKCLQNLANKIEFGEKEDFMTFMNPCIEKYSPKLDKFYGDFVNPKKWAKIDEDQYREDVKRVVSVMINEIVFEVLSKMEDDLVEAIADRKVAKSLSSILADIRQKQLENARSEPV
eukprot:CAMPEP_0174274962 /NCGR_PEP_ID=MMETSP0439-20130205/59565_1 /TAXON_ID=0 /ORGANISM="Stereomyxa ramosa, Strain Chinc5" /LENGTH=316 /DNA_ID=CAMNT_0015367023 /DNA_START=843 /DNA_END=1793 /DNA_ORIENTATION=-